MGLGAEATSPLAEQQQDREFDFFFFLSPLQDVSLLSQPLLVSPVQRHSRESACPCWSRRPGAHTLAQTLPGPATSAVALGTYPRGPKQKKVCLGPRESCVITVPRPHGQMWPHCRGRGLESTGLSGKGWTVQAGGAGAHAPHWGPPRGGICSPPAWVPSIPVLTLSPGGPLEPSIAV